MFWEKRNQRHLEEKRALDGIQQSAPNSPPVNQSANRRNVVSDMEALRVFGITPQGRA